MEGPSTLRRILLLCVLVGVHHAAWAAGGLSLPFQSTPVTGAAFAFGPTIDDAASATFFNPAGLSALDRQHLNLGGVLLNLEYHITGRGIFNPKQTQERKIVSGPQTVEPGTLAAAPDLYYAHPLSDHLTFGAGLNVPFGFIQKFPNDWTGRYQATSTFLITQSLNLALGWEVSPKLRVGFGLNIQYFFMNISNRVDTGTKLEVLFDKRCPRVVNSTGSVLLGGILDQVGLANLVNGLIGGLPASEALCGTSTTTGLIEPTTLNGNFGFENEFVVDDIGFGFNVGVQYEITPDTRIGVAFRSQVKHTLTGKANRNNGGNLRLARRLADPQTSDSALLQPVLRLRETATGFAAGQTYPSLVILKALQNSNDQVVQVDLTTPETLSIGIEHDVTDRLTVAVNYEWTNWSTFDVLKFRYTSEPRFYDKVFRKVIGRELRPTERVDRRQNPTVLPLNFSDSKRYGIGFEYRYSENLILRSGFATATPVVTADTDTAGVRTPSGDYYYYTVGATYRLDPGAALDFALGYWQINGRRIKQKNVASGSFNLFRGKFTDVHALIVGLTLRQRF